MAKRNKGQRNAPQATENTENMIENTETGAVTTTTGDETAEVVAETAEVEIDEQSPEAIAARNAARLAAQAEADAAQAEADAIAQKAIAEAMAKAGDEPDADAKPEQGGDAPATEVAADAPGTEVTAQAPAEEVVAEEEKPVRKGTIVPDSFKERYKAHGGNNGDELASILADKLKTKTGTDMNRMIAIGTANGIDVVERWGHLNVGQQRMNMGNVLRQRLVRGEYVVVEEHEWFPEGKPAANTEKAVA